MARRSLINDDDDDNDDFDDPIEADDDEVYQDHWQEFHHKNFRQGRPDLLGMIKKTDKVESASKDEVEDLRQEVNDMKKTIVRMEEMMKQVHVMVQRAFESQLQQQQQCQQSQQCHPERSTSVSSTVSSTAALSNSQSTISSEEKRKKMSRGDRSLSPDSRRRHHSAPLEELGGTFHPLDVEEVRDRLRSTSARRCNDNNDSLSSSMMSMSMLLSTLDPNENDMSQMEKCSMNASAFLGDSGGDNGASSTSLFNRIELEEDDLLSAIPEDRAASLNNLERSVPIDVVSNYSVARA